MYSPYSVIVIRMQDQHSPGSFWPALFLNSFSSDSWKIKLLAIRVPVSLPHLISLPASLQYCASKAPGQHVLVKVTLQLDYLYPALADELMLIGAWRTVLLDNKFCWCKQVVLLICWIPASFWSLVIIRVLGKVFCEIISQLNTAKI